MSLLPTAHEDYTHAVNVENAKKAELFDWLLAQPAVVAQAFFWNYSSRSERKKAIRNAMKEPRK